MLDIEVALARWTNRVESSAIDRIPKVWVGHWGKGMLGEFGLPKAQNVAQAVFWMMSPFAFSDSIRSSFLVIDSPPWVYVARLAMMGSGGLTTFWRVSYSIDDYGQIKFNEAELTPWRWDRVPEALSTVLQRRLEGPANHSFDDLYATAIELLEQM